MACGLLGLISSSKRIWYSRLAKSLFNQATRVEKDRPRKKQGDDAVIQLEFDPRMVR